MPKHKHVTTCRKSGGPISKHCSCEHCTLDVCAACGLWEGSLTTDCPGAKVALDRQQEICETSLDYTEARGWHLSEARRSPRFEHAATAPEPRPADPRALIAPSVNWGTVDRAADLQHALASRAIAWVVADRTCEEHSAAVTRIKNEVGALIADGNAPADLGELLAKLEGEEVSFHLADQRAQRCDDEFRQAARILVAALEEPSIVSVVGEQNVDAVRSLSAVEARVIIDAFRGGAFDKERAKQLRVIVDRLATLESGS